MNIVVRTAGGRYIVRPDTTWERDNEDVFLPEFVNRVSYAPVLFARINKPGRSVSEKFAERYYDGIGYGVLLYPEDLIDGSEEGFSCASCLDHTSFLTFPVYNKVTLGRPGNIFELQRGSETIFSHGGASAEMICKAIEEATRYIYIRTGDILAIELESRRLLCSREEGEVHVTGKFCRNDNVLDFKIIF